MFRSVAVAAAALSLCVAALAEPAAVATATASAPTASPFPLHGSASLSHSVGSGTFVIAPSNPTVSSLLALNGSATLDDFTLSVSQRLGFEYTQSDSTTYAQQLELSDTTLGASYGGLKMEDWQLGFSLKGTYSLPISLGSRFVGSLGALGLSGRFSWEAPLPGLAVTGSLTTRYNPALSALAARYANAPGRTFAERTLGQTPTQVCTIRNEAELAAFPCSGPPNALRWGVGVGTSYSFYDGALTASADLIYGQGFSSYVPNDSALSLGYDDLSSVNAVAGIVPRQSTTGSLGLSWSPNPWFSLSLGASSDQPLLTLDGKGVRLPFWDFVSPYNNFSSLSIDTAFSI